MCLKLEALKIRGAVRALNRMDLIKRRHVNQVFKRWKDGNRDYLKKRVWSMAFVRVGVFVGFTQ